jgi:hypothetical protein
LIEVICPDLGGRLRVHGQLELPKQPPIFIDLSPAARVYFKVPSTNWAWYRARAMFWHPGDRLGPKKAPWWPDGVVPEASDGVVRDERGVTVVARWQVMGLDENCRTQHFAPVGDWDPTVLMECAYYVRTDR